MVDVEKLLHAVKQFLITLWRILRQLFHEVTGALFLALAAVGGLASWREWTAYHHAAESGLFRPIAATVFAGLMIWFGLTSLLRAKRLSPLPQSGTTRASRTPKAR